MVRSRRLGERLRSFRETLPPSTTCIGSVARHERKFGRPVSQEEIALALNVSRRYYIDLENGHLDHVSGTLASRVADLLQLYGIARAELLAGREGVEVENTGHDHVYRFAKKWESYTSFSDALRAASDTLERIVKPTCAAVIATLDNDEYGVGPREQYWTLDHAQSMIEMMPPEPGVTVVECFPSYDEAAHLALKHSMKGEYTHAFEQERYMRLQRDYQVRSGIMVPVFDKGDFGGILGFGFTVPRLVSAVEVHVAQTLAQMINMISRGAAT